MELKMTLYSLISLLLSYVFTTIIYLFIFSVIRLIYMDIKKMSGYGSKAKAEQGEYLGENSAYLKPIKNSESSKYNLKNYKLTGEPVVIGRGDTSDIRINNKFLSLEHFQIWFEDDAWYIADLGSRNGTFLNGKKIKKVFSLDDGDEVEAGGLQFVFAIG